VRRFPKLEVFPLPDGPQAFTVATDDVIARLVREASVRLVVVAPAVSLPVAKAISEKIQALPADAITVVFDSDPEVYRLGYGTLEALDVVEQAAGARGLMIRRQPGVRIGIIIADDETLIFAPTAALVEAGPNTQGAANAIRLLAPPRTIEADLAIRDEGTAERRPQSADACRCSGTETRPGRQPAAEVRSGPQGSSVQRLH
jgi:hypothetical protein